MKHIIPALTVLALTIGFVTFAASTAEARNDLYCKGKGCGPILPAAKADTDGTCAGRLGVIPKGCVLDKSTGRYYPRYPKIRILQ